MIYTSGMAILYLPFFLIGHVWAKLGGYPTDGFSYPYQFCVSSGMMIYVLVGIFFLRKILLKFYSERTTSITIIIIALGTNYLREAIDYNMGPHAVLFSIYALLLFYTIKWHEQPTKKFVSIIGLSIGFLTLIRPTEIICIFIPLLWGIHDKNSLKEKLTLLKSKTKDLALLVLMIFLVGLPQLIYWKYQTGSFFYNSYWNQNSFDITESHFLKVFFSIRKGWWFYTPLITLAFIGCFYLKSDKLKNVRLSIFVFILLNVFILTHVPVWHNAGSFGQRFMVQSYAMLSIPLGAFIHNISNRNNFIKLGMGIIILLLIILNLFQTWQFVRWILPGDGITWSFYKHSFLKTTPMTKDDLGLLELQRTFDPLEKFDETNPLYKKHTVAFFNMEDPNRSEINKVCLDTTYSKSGNYCCLLSKECEFSPVISKPYSHITDKDHAWLKFSVWFYPIIDTKDYAAEIVIHFMHNGKPYQYWGYPIAAADYKLNEWNKYTIYYLSPLLQNEDDEVRAYVWYKSGNTPLYIDDIQIDAFDKKE
ncbi:MAG: hypothetical protein J0L87_02340 [Bacteroidetes bacterium]|nr:hypothetical protein [Bacteroidota bacterium]